MPVVLDFRSGDLRVCPPGSERGIRASSWAGERSLVKTTTRISAVAALASLGLGIAAASPASAEEPYPGASPQQLAAITEARAFFNIYGVDSETQNDLFLKYLKGERWDSFSSDSTPLHVERTIEAGFDKSVS
jgi:hypothetical protein